MARGFSLLEEALLVSEAEDRNIEQYTKVAAAVQNAGQCYWVFYDEKKSYHPDKAWIILFKRVDRIESSKEAEPYAINIRYEWNQSPPSISYCWWPFSCTISHLLSLLHQQLFLPVHSMLVPVRQLLCCTAVLFKAQHCRVKSVFFTFCVCLFVTHYCVIKYYKPITVLYSRLCQLGT